MTSFITVMKKTRILQVGAFPENPSIIKGGVESSVYGLTMELGRRDNVRVKVLNFPKKEIAKDYKQTIGNAEVAYFSNAFRFQALSFLCLYKLIREIRRFKPDVCHVHGTYFDVLILLAYLKLKGIRTLVTVHGILTVEQQDEFRRRKNFKTLFQLVYYATVEMLILNACKEVIVNTAYVSNWITSRRYVLAMPQIHIIPQGIDEVFAGIADDWQKEQVVSVGSISRRKGYEYSITAVRALTQKFPGLKYFIAGMLYDQDYYKELKALVVTLGLEQQVFMLPDLPKEQVLELIGGAYVFVLHSQEESQGIAFCEAMAAGKPVVATNVGGIPDVVKHRRNGLLSAYGDVEKFSENIDIILSSDIIRREMGEVNRSDAQEYLWSEIARKVLGVYKVAADVEPELKAESCVYN